MMDNTNLNNNAQDIRRIVDEINSALFSYRSAVSLGSGSLAAKERLKNLLFTYCEELLNAASHAKTLADQVEEAENRASLFEKALADADEENADLKRKLLEYETENVTVLAKAPVKKKRAAESGGEE